MPGSLPIAALEQKHPEWTEHHLFWEQIRLLYRGGWEIKQRPSLFLWSRPVEPPAVYASRCAQLIYQNILGTALGWYISKLSEDPLQIFVRENDAAADESILGPFLENCDRTGTPLIDMAPKWLETAALYGKSYTLIDLPTPERALNLRQQKESGGLDPYLVNFTPEQVTNWAEDRYGNLSWVLISTEESSQVLGDRAIITDRWYYFDATTFRVYESERDESGAKAADKSATLVAEGPHALAELGKVPVRRLTMPQGLQLGNRVYPQVLAHLNQDNAYQWALQMGCLPVPVITGDYEEAPKISETAYIKLNQGSTFGFTEPAGTAYKVSSERIAALREEIYRLMYLQAQGRSSSASASASSGYSKEMDMAPSADVMNQYGALLRGEIRSTALDAAFIRGKKDLAVEVQGLQYEDRDDLSDIVSAQAALDLDIPSDLFEKWVYRQAAQKFLKGAATPDDLRDIEKEIEAAPTRSEREQAQQNAAVQGFNSALEQSLARQSIRQSL